MKQLALTIGGTTVQLPDPIQNVNNSAGFLGIHLINNSVSLILYVAIILAFIFFLIGGIKWITSQGDKKQVEEAQKTITFAIVGLIVIFASFFIINIIGFAFGVKLIGNPLTGH